MRNVEALGGKIHRVAARGFKPGPEDFNKLLEARELGAFFLKVPHEGDLCALDAHFQPPAARFLRFRHDGNAAVREFGEKLRQALREFRIRRIGLDDEKRRDRQIRIMLAHEGFNQLSLRGEGAVFARADFREDRAVAEVSAAPHHGEVDGGRAVAHGRSRNVGVDVAARGFDRLLVAHLRKRCNAVA